MKVIALVTQKGGTGKTTLAVSLAVAAAEAGEKVLALDFDPQGSLAAWGDERKADTPHVEKLPGEQAVRLPEALAAVAKKGFTLAILDTAGADNPITHAAMNVADLCLVPLRPTRLDGLAVWPTVQAVMRLQRQFAFVLTQCPTGAHNTRATEMAAGLRAIGILAEPLMYQRADHQDAFANGQGVTEYASNGKAAAEVRALWGWIVKYTKGKKR